MLSDDIRSGFQFLALCGALSGAWLDNNPDYRCLGRDLTEQIKALRSYRAGEEIHPGYIATRTIEARDETFPDSITAPGENDRYGCGCCLCGRCCNVITKDYVNSAAYQLGR